MFISEELLIKVGQTWKIRKFKEKLYSWFPTRCYYNNAIVFSNKVFLNRRNSVVAHWPLPLRSRLHSANIINSRNLIQFHRHFSLVTFASPQNLPLIKRIPIIKLIFIIKEVSLQSSSSKEVFSTRHRTQSKAIKLYAHYNHKSNGRSKRKKRERIKIPTTTFAIVSHISKHHKAAGQFPGTQQNTNVSSSKTSRTNSLNWISHTQKPWLSLPTPPPPSTTAQPQSNKTEITFWFKFKKENVCVSFDLHRLETEKSNNMLTTVTSISTSIGELHEPQQFAFNPTTTKKRRH